METIAKIIITITIMVLPSALILEIIESYQGKKHRKDTIDSAVKQLNQEIGG